ncbi:hypothetical protein GOEFS_067_00010 [Gordonia effusa NBRC 100432]|uniref:DUF3298 domain-containing protein n=1 Tax=Gordonia effusa NBRC 100432 TaxID=1077974 RepID=H0R194_9ACTN|nr:hypothetical protein [Gordonia effusa]GAB18845.1 hypothetical protein GOEFS_067_00010 [Gordonia effusa NBRC 100432]
MLVGVERNRPRAHLLVGLMIAGALGLTSCTGDPAGPTSTSTAPRTTSVYASSSASSSVAQSTSNTAGYRPGVIRRAGSIGNARYDVSVPQVSGGNPRIAALFNQSATAVSHDFVSGLAKSRAVTTIQDSDLGSTESTRVATITDRVIAGVSIYLWYTKGTAHPNFGLSTVVVDVARARPIQRDELFSDPAGAKSRLAQLAAAHDRTGRLSRSLSIATVPEWVPTVDGLRVYISVSHAAGDFVPVTIPWSEIRSEIAPDLHETLGAE